MRRSAIIQPVSAFLQPFSFCYAVHAYLSVLSAMTVVQAWCMFIFSSFIIPLTVFQVLSVCSCACRPCLSEVVPCSTQLQFVMQALVKLSVRTVVAFVLRHCTYWNFKGCNNVWKAAWLRKCQCGCQLVWKSRSNPCIRIVCACASWAIDGGNVQFMWALVGWQGGKYLQCMCFTVHQWIFKHLTGNDAAGRNSWGRCHTISRLLSSKAYLIAVLLSVRRQTLQHIQEATHG